GWSSFARCLIEVRADATLKDTVTMGIPLPDGEGFTKETVQNVKGIPIVDKMNNGGFQMVVNKRKSFKTGSTINNHSGAAAGLHVPTSKPSVPTSSAYDVLDDIESEEEAEVVYDETAILKDARTGASPSMAPNGSNT
ncbi:hypothetical protein Tco_0708522, partial [Tanacetum coccineum]